tara:strand:- start:202 stop:948 length:747 start_codon:yes stop_codon:yes gene_type:complete
MLLNLKNLVIKYSIQPSGIIHIGAHTGEEVDTYNKYFKNNLSIHLFEPQDKYFKILKDKYSNIKNIKLYNFACGERKEKLNLNVASNDGVSSSLLKPKIHLEIHPDVQFNIKEKVSVDKLDNFNINDSDFLNIDVQGFELKVLNGAKHTLPKINYIYLEINKEEVYESAPMIGEIDEFLSKFNFIRVSTKYAYDTLPWGDALYLNLNKLTNIQILKSKLKKFIYSKKNLYELYIYFRRIFWKIKIFFA